MRQIHVQRQAFEPADYKMRHASENDYLNFITEDVVVYENGNPMIVYEQLQGAEWDSTAIVDVLQRLDYRADFRTGGLPTNSRTFGFAPRNTVRRDYCSAAALAVDDPVGHAIIASYAKRISEHYSRENPELYMAHMQESEERILADYILQGSPFTSGIINFNSQLPYHHDSGNFKNVWSAMLVYKRFCRGGYLSVPEYGMGFELRNNALFLFDGQGLLHGVTPIRLTRKDGFRYSIVFYTLQQMWQCLPVQEEVKRITSVKTERERKRLNPQRTAAEVKGKSK